MTIETQYNSFIEQYSGSVKRNESMSAYTTFRTGGDADLFVEASSGDQLSQAIQLARRLGIPYFVIGGGSNLLVSDSGYRGLIIRNAILGKDVQGNALIIGAGEQLDAAVDFATECSLTGLEFAAGIWGTVGGAVYGNAGAFGSQIGSVLAYADLINAEGAVRREAKEYYRFAYRHSYLKTTGEIVANVCFSLEPGNREAIGRRTSEIRDMRKGKHPVTPCSAGCFFKNIEDPSRPGGKLPAGKLLEEAGGKELRVGGAAVFGSHANILVNTGTATSKDIRELADILKRKVKEKFDIDLQEEVISLGEF